ncbi:hypothetical protein [Shewanella morhuae]|uniref:hypothetical protein n=1 Tax=Shewanella morhuae TaxID=365591 RepID=UPI001BC4BC51|nr:hypothetical protein [Shewanella morhuae]GIU04733.1 hypothetical protein TUM4641_13420 [Shewanella morhuae]
MDLLSLTIGFLIGTATGAAGAYIGDKCTDIRREKLATAAQKKLFSKLWDNHKELLSEMKQDMENPDYKFHRFFWVFQSSSIFNHDGHYLAYHPDKHLSLEHQLKTLESQGFISNISEPGKIVSKYQIHESLVEHLRAQKV